MSIKEIEAGKAVVEVGIRDRIRQGLQAAKAKLTDFAASVQSMGKSILVGGAAITGAAAAVGAPIVAAATSFASTGASIDDMSQRTGIAASSLSALAHAASMSGTSMQTVEGGVRKMQKALGEAAQGNKTAIATFEGLGLNVDKLLKMKPDRQFAAIAEKIATIKDPTLKAAAAMDIFGKSGAELVPLISSNVSELIDRAHALGIVMGEEDVAAAARLDDAFQELSNAGLGAFNQIGAAVAAPLASIVELTTSVIAAATQFIKENRSIVVAVATVASAMGAAGVAVTGLGGGMIILGSIINAGVAVFSLLATAAAAVGAPIAVLVGIVAAATASFVVYGSIIAYVAAQSGLLSEAVEFVSRTFKSLTDIVQVTVGGVTSALKAGEWGLAVKIAWQGVKVLFLQGAQAALEGVSYLWNNTTKLTVRFLSSFAQMMFNVFKKIPSLLMAALRGGVAFNQILASALTGQLDLGGMMDGTLKSARDELAKLQAEAQAKANPTQAPQPVAGQPKMIAAVPAAAVPGAVPAAAPAAQPAGPQPVRNAEGMIEDPRLVAARQQFAQRELDRQKKLQADMLAIQQARANAPGIRSPAAKANGELQQAIADAKTGASNQGPKIPQLAAAIESGTAQTQKTAATGTFSAAAAATMGRGSNRPDDRTANNTRLMVSILKRMEKKKGNLRWA